MNKFSIILPVKNGSNHIRECINSILAQTFKNFELVILENCSTDNTADIIASFDDARIKLYPSEKPLTIEENWQRIKEVSRNEFMTLIGHDDMLGKDYLLYMDEFIQSNPLASLYQAHFNYIDSQGTEIGKCKLMEEIQGPEKVIHNFLSNKTDLMGTGFMMRSTDYDSVGGIPPYPNLLFADMELWIELSIKNFLAVDSRETFSYRKHTAATTSTSSDAKFLQAFELLMQYLFSLRKRRPDLSPAIVRDSEELLRQYCQGITHRILRTPGNMRKAPPVSTVIEQFRSYGEKMGNRFEPLAYRNIRFGKIVDSNSLLHSLFLLFKKFYHKPFLKN